MKPIKVHVVYEYGQDLRPHASSYIRLLRPLGHPSLAERLQFTYSARYDGQPADVVIIDRLWRPDITPDRLAPLLTAVRRSGARLIYAIDDNLLDLRQDRKDWPQDHHIEVLCSLLTAADRVWVSTAPLGERFARFNPHMTVIPNQLDERLLAGGPHRLPGDPFQAERVVIGYMGTLTHNDDLRMVLPALQAVFQRHPGKLELQVVGVAAAEELREMFAGLRVRLLNPPDNEAEYPLFQFWLAEHARWDIAISPLRDTPFTRCKSDIKFLDYSAIGAAGIYSRVTAYQSSVVDRETGWLAENTSQAWEAALEALVQDAGLRQRMARNAAHYLHTRRTLVNTSHTWLEALEAAVS